MKKAEFDQHGLPISFYDDGIHKSIPKAAIELSDEDWREFIENAGRRAWRNGAVVVFDPSSLFDLATLKADLKIAIDGEAEAARLRYITAGSGQAMTYQQKAAEAAACLSAEDPQDADYPLLRAEIGVTGATLRDVAAVVNDNHEQWKVVGAQIEALRLGGKAAVDGAATIAAARAATNIPWP